MKGKRDQDSAQESEDKLVLCHLITVHFTCVCPVQELKQTFFVGFRLVLISVQIICRLQGAFATQILQVSACND